MGKEFLRLGGERAFMVEGITLYKGRGKHVFYMEADQGGRPTLH